MKFTTLLARHLREVYFGGNWTTVALKDVLEDVTWKEALTTIPSFNNIAILVNHMTYYVAGVTKVLQGGKLETKDALSFDHQPINSQKDWEDFKERIWQDARTFADLIEQLPDTQLKEDFIDKKYGLYFRNLVGIIEHFHYHLGQIVMLKKLIKKK